MLRDTGVSIVIKALNEERNIERALRSALIAIDVLGGAGEVILADSLSSDRTIEIAATFPVRIVQLEDAKDRCCGVGAELGMRVAAGQYVYVLDADMEIDCSFLPSALAALEADPKLAGVAGVVEEMCVSNYAFKGRAGRVSSVNASTNLIYLDGGALYRRLAIEEVGYLTNRNLHANEELELGIRLVHAGWRLQRLNILAARHYGHTDTSYSLLVRRWRSRYAWGHGEILRQTWNHQYFWLVVRHLRVLRVTAFSFLVWLFIGFLTWFLGPVSALASGLILWLGVIIVMAIRKHSLGAAVYAFVSWHFNLAAIIAGWFRQPLGNPVGHFRYRILR
jgi:glycosyltransferase involved in cell wall biosynthesis